MSAITIRKKLIRKESKQKFEEMIDQKNIRLKQMSDKICDRLKQLINFLDIRENDLIHCFSPIIGIEPNIWKIIEERKKVVIPKIISITDGTMEHYLYKGLRKSDLEENKYAIFEPRSFLDPIDNKNLTKIKLIIIPLVAFDQKGFSIGKGAEFYDRFLAKDEITNAIKVGVSFIEDKKELPFEDYNIKLDWCVTSNRIYNFGNRTISPISY